MKTMVKYIVLILCFSLLLPTKAQSMQSLSAIYPYFMDCFVSIALNGNKINCSNGYELYAYNDGEICGIGKYILFNGSGYWSLRVYGQSTDRHKIDLILHDTTKNKYYDICNYSLVYQSHHFIGYPKNTVRISFSDNFFINGDINGDNKITIADISLLVDQLIGNGDIVSRYADLNNDGTVTVADISLLVSYLLNNNKITE